MEKRPMIASVTNSQAISGLFILSCSGCRIDRKSRTPVKNAG